MGSCYLVGDLIGLVRQVLGRGQNCSEGEETIYMVHNLMRDQGYPKDRSSGGTKIAVKVVGEVTVDSS